MSRKATRLTECGVVLLLAAALAALLLRLRGFGECVELAERYRILCDAFTIPGVLLVSLYFLVVLSKHGALDGISFGLKRLAALLIPFSGSKFETYADFIESREEKKAKPAPHAMLYVGLAFLALAIVFLLLFNRVYVGSDVTA